MTDLVDIEDLETVRKGGKTYIRMSSIPTKLPKEKVDDTVPDEIKELLLTYQS